MSDKKKLYRNKEAGKLLGVCAGLADYFELDVTIIRVIWILAVLFGFGSGIIAYLIAALVMPEKPSDTKPVGKE